MADIVRAIYVFGDSNEVHLSGWVLEDAKDEIRSSLSAVNPPDFGNSGGVAPTIVGWETRGMEAEA